MLTVNSSRKTVCGLTLIEVMVALAIVGIAMTAIIKATSQTIRSTSYLQQKTLAMLVGQQVLNEASVGLIHLPGGDDKLKQTTTMLGQDWPWEAGSEETPNQHIRKIKVDVFGASSQDNPVVSLETYVYRQED